MIILHRKENDPASERLKEKLKSLVISFEIKNHVKNETKHDLPFIKESGRIIAGENNIERWLQELESELKWQRSLTGDGCFIHPESGKIC